MTQYPIEKGIPLKAPGKWIRQYSEMEPGDSFMIPDEDMLKGFRATQSSINASTRNSGHKITTRRVDGGLRVWLIEKPEK